MIIEEKFYWCRPVDSVRKTIVRTTRYLDNEDTSNSSTYTMYHVLGDKYHTGSTRFNRDYILGDEIRDEY